MSFQTKSNTMIFNVTTELPAFKCDTIHNFNSNSISQYFHIIYKHKVILNIFLQIYMCFLVNHIVNKLYWSHEILQFLTLSNRVWNIKEPSDTTNFSCPIVIFSLKYVYQSNV